MIHWGWLVAAFCTGGLAGVFITSLCTVAGNADERMEEMHKQLREEADHV